MVGSSLVGVILLKATSHLFGSRAAVTFLSLLRCPRVLLLALSFLALMITRVTYAVPCTLEVKLTMPHLPLNSGDQIVVGTPTGPSHITSVKVKVDLVDMTPPEISRIGADGSLHLIAGYSSRADVILDPKQAVQYVTVSVQDDSGNCGLTRATARIRDTSPVAIVIGVDKNKLTSQSLRYARADAVAMVEHLVEATKLDPKNIWLLTHDISADSLKYSVNLREIPTPDAISTAIAEAAQRTAPDTAIYFYFSGHQYVRLPTSKYDTESNYFFVLPNSIPNPSGLSTMYSWDDLAKALYQIDQRVIITIIDSCYSGSVTARYPSSADSSSEGAPKQLGVLTGKELPRKAKLNADALLTSSSGSGLSWEFRDLGHGVFTKFILLSDDWARERAEDVTIDDLFYGVELDGHPGKGVKGMTKGYNPVVSGIEYKQIPSADINDIAHDKLWAHYKKD
jgi:hypothetical protein